MESARIPSGLPGTSPPTSHIILLLSTIFCVTGGTLLLISAGLGWIIEMSGNGSALDPGRIWYFNDLGEYSGAYSWIFAIMVGGAMTIALSLLGIALRKTRRQTVLHMTCVLTSFATTIIVAAILIWISRDISAIAENAILGPAPYLAVFGCVLEIAGGSMLLLDILQHYHPYGPRVRPTPMPHSAGVGGHQWEYRGEGVTDRICPGCKSPVKSDWQICPVCGRVLH